MQGTNLVLRVYPLTWLARHLPRIQILCTHITIYSTLVPEALCEAKETRGEKQEPLVISIANPTSTLDQVQNLNLACDWPFVKICQTGLGNKHYFIKANPLRSRLSFLSPRKEPLEPGYIYSCIVKNSVSGRHTERQIRQTQTYKQAAMSCGKDSRVLRTTYRTNQDNTSNQQGHVQGSHIICLT